MSLLAVRRWPNGRKQVAVMKEWVKMLSLNSWSLNVSQMQCTHWEEWGLFTVSCYHLHNGSLTVWCVSMAVISIRMFETMVGRPLLHPACVLLFQGHQYEIPWSNGWVINLLYRLGPSVSTLHHRDDQQGSQETTNKWTTSCMKIIRIYMVNYFVLHS